MINRRQFLLLTVGLAAGCQSVNDNGKATIPAGHLVNAGPVGNYTRDGVYGKYRDWGFFVIRRGDRLLVLSAICTHRKCKLSIEPDSSFFCKCHGSAFDPSGHVTHGPARLDLPELPCFTNDRGELVVTVTSS